MTESDIHREIKNSKPVIHNNEANKLKVSFLLRRIAQLLLYLRPAAATSSPSSTPSSTVDLITVVCISDTHNFTPDLVPGDLLIHSGDLSQHGTFNEIQAQINWLKKQPHKHKIVIGGNHDLILDTTFAKRYPDREPSSPGKSAKDLDWGDIIYLENSSTTLKIHDRSIKIFGSPYIPHCGNYAFQYLASEDFYHKLIPDDTDVVVTHGPPALHFDRDEGCPHLLKELWRVKPRLVVFGHMHHLRGKERLGLSRSQEVFEALAAGIESWGSLPSLVWAVVRERVWPPAQVGEMQLVNAACFKGEDRMVVTI